VNYYSQSYMYMQCVRYVRMCDVSVFWLDVRLTDWVGFWCEAGQLLCITTQLVSLAYTGTRLFCMILLAGIALQWLYSVCLCCGCLMA